VIVKAPAFGWGGLNTRANATGLPLLECVHLQDMRVVGTDLVQRLGMVRAGQVSGDLKSMDFDSASSEYCSAAVDTRVWTLGLKFSIDVVFNADSVSGARPIFQAGSTTASCSLVIDSSEVRFRFWDSAATQTTLTVASASTGLHTVRVVRDGASLSTFYDGAAGGSTTVEAALLSRAPAGNINVATDNATNFFDGKIDTVVLRTTTASHHRDRLVRAPSPRAEDVTACYDFNESAGNLVYDRSRYENHLITVNTPSEATALCHNPAFVRALSMSVDVTTNKKQILVAAGGKHYLVGVD
jgi:hypothetical protein